MGGVCLRFKSWCLSKDLTERDLLLETCTKYRTELWYLPIYDIVQSLTTEDINPLRKRFFQEIAHYETNDVNQSFTSESFVDQLECIPPEEKQKSLRELISRCYMVIDEEELPGNNRRELMPGIATQELFTESILGDLSHSSLLTEDTEALRRDRTERLLRFDPEVIRKFRNFANLCEEVRKHFQTQGSLIERLLRNFKASMTTFEQQSNNRINLSDQNFRKKFKDSVLNFIEFMMKMVVHVYLLDKAGKNEGDSTFFLDQNIHTLIVSLLFEDTDFQRVAVRVYDITLHTCIQRFKGHHHKYQITNRTNLFSPTNLRDDPYFNSLRMLDRVLSVPQPILKLKVLQEVNLRIIKDIQKQRNRDKVINAQDLRNHIGEMLGRCQKYRIVTHIMLTWDFIHENYRMGKLGSIIAPFMAVVGCQ